MTIAQVQSVELETITVLGLAIARGDIELASWILPFLVVTVSVVVWFVRRRRQRLTEAYQLNRANGQLRILHERITDQAIELERTLNALESISRTFKDEYQSLNMNERFELVSAWNRKRADLRARSRVLGDYVSKNTQTGQAIPIAAGQQPEVLDALSAISDQLHAISAVDGISPFDDWPIPNWTSLRSPTSALKSTIQD